MIPGMPTAKKHDMKRFLWNLQRGLCDCCALKMAWPGNCEKHHIRPKVVGGGNNEDNLCLLCVDCHRKAHSGRKKERHSVLHVIFTKRGYSAEKRSMLYHLYRLKAVNKKRQPGFDVGPLWEHTRWENDGGSTAYYDQRVSV